MFPLIQDIFTVVVWVLCPLLILLILVQGGSGDMSSTFGGGGQLDSTLGVGASRKMAQITVALSSLFLILVLIMAIEPSKGLMARKGKQAAKQEAPAKVPSAEDAKAGEANAEPEGEVKATDGANPAAADAKPEADKAAEAGAKSAGAVDEKVEVKPADAGKAEPAKP